MTRIDAHREHGGEMSRGFARRGRGLAGTGLAVAVCVLLGSAGAAQALPLGQMHLAEETRADDDDLVVDVPDPALAEALKERIGEDTITRGALGRITTLAINGLPISDLTGLEHATRLNDFEMKNTAVTSLAPLGDLQQLAYFFAGGSPVESIEPLRGLPKLNYVSLNSTSVTDLDPLDGAPNLVRLEIASTRVSSLEPLRHSPMLREVYFQDTAVSSLEALGGLLELRTISGPNAQLTDLSPIAGLPELTLLNVNGNSVSDVSMFGTWPKLQQVGFAAQRLTGATAFVSATETSFRFTDAPADFRMPNDGKVELLSGAEPLPGGGMVWPGLDAGTTELSASFTHEIGESGPTYSATVTYPVVFVDFDAAPAPESRVSGVAETPVSFDFSADPGFSGGSYRLLGDEVPGLVLGDDGLLSGSPETAGEYAVSVGLTDRHGNEITRSFTFVVEAKNPGPIVDPEDDGDDTGGKLTPAAPQSPQATAIAATGDSGIAGIAASGLALLALGGIAWWTSRRRAAR